jgi:hypothetical protein
MSSRKLSTLRVCDADERTANRTPSAWMISLAIFFAHGQIVFFVWVDLGKRKWSILAARRSSKLLKNRGNQKIIHAIAWPAKDW